MHRLIKGWKMPQHFVNYLKHDNVLMKISNLKCFLQDSQWKLSSKYHFPRAGVAENILDYWVGVFNVRKIISGHSLWLWLNGFLINKAYLRCFTSLRSGQSFLVSKSCALTLKTMQYRIRSTELKHKKVPLMKEGVVSHALMHFWVGTMDAGTYILVQWPGKKTLRNAWTRNWSSLWVVWENLCCKLI